MPRLSRPALAGALCALLLAGCGDPPGRTEASAAAILREWDHRRAEAWATGSVADLGALYVPGSTTGAADVRMLRAWRARGMVVEDLTTQLLRVKVLARSAHRLRMSVTDRVVWAAAAGTRGATLRIALPRDQPSTYVIDLASYDGVWLVRETTAA